MKHTFLTTLLVLAAMSRVVDAQEEPPPRGWLHSVNGAYLYQTNSGLEDGGEFGLDQFALQYGLSNFLPEGNVYGISINYAWWGYNFNGSNSLGQADPWSDISMIDLGFPLFYHLTDTWDVFAVPTLRTTFENGAGLSDGITVGGLFGMSREFSDTLTLGPGFGLYSELEDSVNFFPLIVINWKLDEFWSVETGRGLGATLGPGVFMNYDPSKKVRFQFGGRYESLRFRIDDEGVAPGGVGEDKNFSLFAGARYSPSRSMQFAAFTGWKFSGELILDDRSGNRIEKQSYNDAFFAGVTFKLYFQ